MRKVLFDRYKGLDAYETAVRYIKTTFILDAIATLPQVTSFMNPQYAPLKFFRIFEIMLLHYPFELLIKGIWGQRLHDSQIVSVTFSVMILCQIMLLLQYLAVLFLYIGSEDFLDYEEGRLPWTFANSDFEGYSNS